MSEVVQTLTISAPVGTPTTAQPRAVPLPSIRDELKIIPASFQPDGSPAWVIQDPVRNRFFRIGWLEFELLLNWHDSDMDTLVEMVNIHTTLHISRNDVENFIVFLTENELVRLEHPAQVDHAHKLRNARLLSWGHWLLHNYLFFRVPLVRPQQWLARVSPAIAWLQTPATGWVLAVLTLLGLYLVSRQWDIFTHTFVDQLTWSGMLGYAVALIVAKTAHELGHAFAATRHGVRVAHMGVAFLIMFPMLYTDTGESWRLKDSKHRLTIASAGMVVELALAGLATLAWAITPDGSLRNGLFFLATTSWVLTLAVNLSPFLRFDGYFILSDWLDFPNLHERSGALARTWMRRTLLGFNDPWSETFSANRRRGLIAFALVTWIFRLTLFLGIAVTVYFFFFKVLGIFLMVVELMWFIFNPIKKEVKVWYQRRLEIKSSRLWQGFALLSFVGLLLFLPLQSRVEGHGWLRTNEQQVIYAPFAAQITDLPEQREFKKDETIIVLDSEELGIDQEKSLALAAASQRQIQGLLGIPQGEARRASLSSQKSMYEAQAQASGQQRDRLFLKAPFDGVLHDLGNDLTVGTWVKPQQPLTILINPSYWVVEAFVSEEDLARIDIGHAVRIRQRVDPPAWLNGHVSSIDVTRTTHLPSPMLEASYGGPIATVAATSGAVTPTGKLARDALYRVRIELQDPMPQARPSLVKVQIEGTPEALIERLVRSVTGVLVRESGF